MSPCQFNTPKVYQILFTFKKKSVFPFLPQAGLNFYSCAECGHVKITKIKN